MLESSRRELLAGFVAAAASAGTTGRAFGEEQRLAQIAGKKGILFGSWARGKSLAKDEQFSALVAEQCGVVVCGVEMFWNVVAKGPNSLNLSGPDAVLDWTMSHGLRFRGHNLVWHETVPSWFAEISDRKEATDAMVNHIRSVCSHYAGKVHSWDVVNEPLEPTQGRPDGLRQSPFLHMIGPEYLDIAFRTAREADPQAMLVCNEYSLEYDFGYMENRRRSILAMIDGFRTRNTPIDAIGIQSHLLTEHQRHFNQETYAKFLQEIADRGLKIFITELDVGDRSAPADVSRRDQEVASVYRAYLDAVLHNPAVTVVVLWGLSDRDSWIVRGQLPAYVRQDGLPPRPLPFDTAYHAKAAFSAIAAAFRAAPVRSA